MVREVVIASAVRTPIGAFQGSLAALTASQLGSAAIKAALQRAGIEGKDVHEVLMGCVLPAGQGQAPARQASRGAGIPDSVGCVTINKVCGSGLKAVMMAAQAIRAGDAEIIVAGGMESMSNVPYLLPQARTGYRLGNGSLIDGLVQPLRDAGFTALRVLAEPPLRRFYQRLGFQATHEGFKLNVRQPAGLTG